MHCSLGFWSEATLIMGCLGDVSPTVTRGIVRACTTLYRGRYFSSLSKRNNNRVGLVTFYLAAILGGSGYET